MSENEKRKVSTKFAGVLALISIIGFVNIITESLFQYSISKYFDSIWLLIVGVGFILSSHPKNLYEGSKRYFSETSFTRLVALIIGLISISAAILSIPQLNFTHYTLATIKSIISLIAIIFIILQTWFVRH